MSEFYWFRRVTIGLSALLVLVAGCKKKAAAPPNHDAAEFQISELARLAFELQKTETLLKLTQETRVRLGESAKAEEATKARQAIYHDSDYLGELRSCFEMLEKRKKALLAEENVYKKIADFPKRDER